MMHLHQKIILNGCKGEPTLWKCKNAQLVCTSDEILYCVKDLQNLHCLQIHRDQVRPQEGMVEYSEKPGKPTFQIYSDQLKFLRS